MERSFPERVEALCETVLSTCAAILCLVVLPIFTLFATLLATCLAALIVCHLVDAVHTASHDPAPTHVEAPR